MVAAGNVANKAGIFIANEKPQASHAELLNCSFVMQNFKIVDMK